MNPECAVCGGALPDDTDMVCAGCSYESYCPACEEADR